MLISQKGEDDMESLNSIFENIISRKTGDIKIHIVYAGLTYFVGFTTEMLDLVFGFIMDAMQRYELESVLVTMLSMERVHLVTKEVMKEYYKGNRTEDKTSWDELFEMYGISMNDDLEEFFEAISLGKYLQDGVENGKGHFFLPKITKEEHRCVLKFIYTSQYISQSD